MNILAKYTNRSDYSEEKTWNVFILDFIYGSIEDRSSSVGRHPEQALAICLFEDGHLEAIRLRQLRALEVPQWNTTPTISVP